MVVDENSFTKAANKLHMTQPAVSQAVKNLENHFNTTLIDRVNKTFYLNKAGKIVYEIGKEIHVKLDKMKQLVGDLHDEVSGEVIIGASYTIGEYMMPQLLAELHDRYPNLHVHIMIGNTKEIGDKLLNHEIDLAFIEGTYEHPNLVAKTFMQDNMFVCSAANDELTSIENLSEQVWLSREVGSGTRHMQEKFLQTHQITPQQFVTLGSTQLIKEAIQTGLGISLMSQTVVAKELALGTIQRCNFEYERVTRDFSLIKYISSFEPKINEIIETIVNEIWSNKTTK